MWAFKTFSYRLVRFHVIQVHLTGETEPIGKNDRPMPVLEIQQRTSAFGYHGINARRIRKPQLVDKTNHRQHGKTPIANILFLACLRLPAFRPSLPRSIYKRHISANSQTLWRVARTTPMYTILILRENTSMCKALNHTLYRS